VLQDWLRAYRRRVRRTQARLTWTRAGRVWAMDYSEPLHPIDGTYRYVLHLRDLASGYYLAALPVRRATTQGVCDLLRAVCARHAAPLVLKVDNGAPFRSHAVRDWAAAAGTQLLPSPPICPRYNGSIEASIGALGARTFHVAAAQGHPDVWTADDLEHARWATNVEAQPRFDATSRVTADERVRLACHYAHHLRVVRAAYGPRRSDAHHRAALVHALTDLGYMSMERRAS
jgi:transposase InsO family protein